MSDDPPRRPRPDPFAQPPGRLRVDPRAARTPRCSPGEAPLPYAAASATPPAPPRGALIVVPTCHDGALSSRDRELIGAARAQAGALGLRTVVLCCTGAAPEELAEAAAAAGAEAFELALHPAFAGDAATERMATVEAVARRLEAVHVVFDDAIPGGGDVGRRLAARTGWGAAGAVVQWRGAEAVRRGNGGRSDFFGPAPRILMLAVDVGQRWTAPAESFATYEAPALAPPSFVADEGLVATDPDSLPIAEADFIVGAGNGMRDWPGFSAMAAALGAARAGSRVVVDSGHLPRARQIGISGTLVEPRCYIAFGIAGASQHLEGIRRCERVVAVNTDLHADMVKRAELAVIQDAQPVMRALAAIARERRARG